MHFLGISKILGALLGIFSITLIPPMLVSLIYDDNAYHAFLWSQLLIILLGLALWWPARNDKKELRFRDGFAVVVLIWVVLSIIGAIPFWLSERPTIGLIDGLFEATSGLTTTGATTLTGLDHLPASILYYRQQLQWLGGMGIIVLAIAVMPALGVGGMQLYRAEMPGAIKDSKLTPRITETAKAIWYIYLGLTVICGLAYYLAGMSVFDAICHAYSTVAIGGFSTHDASMGHFHNNAIYLVACIFMLLAGLNFALHFTVFKYRSVITYFKDPEARVFLCFAAAMVIVVVSVLLYHAVYPTVTDNLVQGMFQVISLGSTTGYTTANFSLWPTFLPMLLILLSTPGGCAGSTAGGMKIIRMMLLFKQGSREISRLIHPSALIPIKLGGKPVSENIINAVWGFLSLYIFTYTLLLIAMLATGVDLITALSSVSASLNNLGPGLGDVAHNYVDITATGKIILTLAMLLGRLELFTVLVLISPVFWRG